MNASARSTDLNYLLSRPLGAGEPVAYSQFGATSEQRYDVADESMQGEMDPFFFLTKHKNFIPHEYPCRTQFAAERRGKRPRPSEVALERIWLPFGSPRVDLSGFWFRPTVIGTWAATRLAAPRQARRLWVCVPAAARSCSSMIVKSARWHLMAATWNPARSTPLR